MDKNTVERHASAIHAHGPRCWWDHREARWVCERSTSSGVDIRDMIVVHTAMLREFRLAPAAVLRVVAGDRRQTKIVDDHLALLCALLHHHHAGEDELLWPVLGPRLNDAQRALVDVAAAQHDGISRALSSVDDTRRRWAREADVGTATELAEALRSLHRLLTEHLEAEERNLLPLAAAYLTEEEWGAIGEAGASGIEKAAMLRVFGMFAYEGDPVVLASMLHTAPPPVRFLVPRLAPRAYARHARRVHGTSRP
jgi:hemerythrin-like domain-containing protein